MAVVLRPQLRPLEIFPVGPKVEPLIALRDPEAFGETVVLSGGAAMLARLMDGRRTLLEIQATFKSQTGVAAALNDLEAIVRQLDDAYLLANDRFERHRREEIDCYLDNPVRPAWFAGSAYEDEPDDLRRQLDGLFTAAAGPGATAATPSSEGRRLSGLICPHIDPHRGGHTFAWAYKQVAEHCDADLFVIFGTVHNHMENLFCVSRKDFDTPLGIVKTDRRFVDRLAGHLADSVAGRQIDPFADELTHRSEHSIEFQAVFLQHLLGGRREFRIVPVLVGSFQEFIDEFRDNGAIPDGSPEVQAFIAAVRSAAAGHTGTVCYIAAADFAHIGSHFGDEHLLDEQRLAAQEADDRRLLEAACRCDSAGFFAHVAQQSDRNRICGLPPTYTMLEVLGPQFRGELLKYDQAVEPDGTSCVSFASVAFHGPAQKKGPGPYLAR